MKFDKWVTWAGIAGVMVCLSAASIQADGKVESQMIDYDISIDGYRASSDRREDTGILMRRAVSQSMNRLSLQDRRDQAESPSDPKVRGWIQPFLSGSKSAEEAKNIPRSGFKNVFKGFLASVSGYGHAPGTPAGERWYKKKAAVSSSIVTVAPKTRDYKMLLDEQYIAHGLTPRYPSKRLAQQGSVGKGSAPPRFKTEGASGLLLNQQTRGANYRREVFDADIVSRQAMKYIGQLALDFMSGLDDDDIFDSDYWTAAVGATEGSTLACDTGGLNLSITRTDYRKLSITVDADNCVVEGERANGEIELAFDDNLNEYSNPRKQFPLTYTMNGFSMTDAAGRAFSYSGGLSCDFAANNPSESYYYVFSQADDSIVDFYFRFDSAFDQAIESSNGYVDSDDRGLTASNLIFAYNCDATNLAVTTGGKQHRVRGQKFIYDEYGDNALITTDRETRTGQIDSGARSDLNGSIARGFDHRDYPMFSFSDARYSQYNSAESLVDTNAETYTIGLTYQITAYLAQTVIDGYPYSGNGSYYTFDFDQDGEPDEIEAPYVSWMDASNACWWNAVWSEGIGLYTEYQPNDAGSCEPTDYFFANTAGEILVEDADGDGISDALDDDSDNDGLSDAAEAQLGTSSILADTDGDGVDDGDDLFPLNPVESVDSDSDGVGDYLDDFPNDASQQSLSLVDALSSVEDAQLAACLELWINVFLGAQSAADVGQLWCGDGFSQFLDDVGLQEIGAAYGWVVGEPIRSLSGIEKFKGITALRLEDPFKNSDLAVINRIRSIEALFLTNSPEINDLSALAEYPSLRALAIEGGGLTNQSLLQLAASDWLPKSLRSLTLAGSFDEISALGDFINLEDLRLGSDALKNLAPIARLPLLAFLGVESAGLKTLEDLKNTDSLTTIGLIAPSLKSIAPIAALPQLDTLFVENAVLIDFGALADSDSLRVLEFRNTGLDSLDFLRGSGGGVSLDLDELYLRGNEIRDLDLLSQLPNLNALSVGENPIRSLDPIGKLSQLEWLSLADTGVRTLSVLDGSNLSYLDASGNNLKTIEPLAGARNLKTLYLEASEVADIQPLSGLQLELVNLEGNQVRSIDAAFNSMSQGEILLDSNPVLCPSLNRFLSQKREAVRLDFDAVACLSDGDDDGLEDTLDVFPSDPSEQLDTDGDSIGNNADEDDDGDGMLDTDELASGFDPLNRYSCEGCFSLDITGDDVAEPLSDGLLVIRYLFGFRGEALLTGAYLGAITPEAISEIESLLEGAIGALDIDGDGASDPLTDGLMIIRYLFGFRGDALFSGATSDASTRSRSEMLGYLEGLTPDDQNQATNPEPVAGAPSASGWVRGEYGDAFDYEAQCQSPRAGSEFEDVQGTTTDENFWLRAYSFDTYLWYDEIEDVDPATVDNTEAYFDLMKTFALSPSGNARDKFHFTYNTEDWKKLSQSGVSAGYGVEFFRVRSSPPRQWLVAYTEPNTPAGDAGLLRGWEIASVDGVDFQQGSDTDTLNAALFPSELGEVHQFVFRDVTDGQTTTVSLISEEITSTPVQSVKVIRSGAKDVGYLLFNDHIATAEEQLIDAFERFKTAGVTELVVDMRYNGGGYLDIARMLASMIVGEEAVGQTFSELQFNDKYPVRNPITGRVLVPSEFTSTAPGFVVSSQTQLPLLSLDRVVVISGGGTCSASEAVINGLRGVGVEVILVGDTTCGKPYGFYGIDNCGTTYFTIQFKGVNATGFGDYTDGFSPPGAESVGVEIGGCSVEDDLGHALGDPEEARLQTALEYLSTGSCGTNAASVSAKRRHPLRAVRGQVVKPAPLSGSILHGPELRVE